MTHRVVFTDHTFDDLDIEREILAEADAELVDAAASDEPLADLVTDADGILVMYDEIDAGLIRSMSECQVISRTGIGVDNVDIDAATEAGIHVTNVPDYCIPEVADHTLGLALALQRKLIEYDRSVEAGEWDVSAGRPMHRLAEQTWGLVGYGNIARAVGDRVEATGMDRIAFDAFLDDEEIRKNGAEPVDSLDELLGRADVVSVHVPLTEETENMVGRAELEAMQNHAYLINCARGGIVDEDALAAALDDGEIAGAGLDVLSEEPPSEDHPLLDDHRMIITPHAAFNSEESVVELRQKAARNARDVLSGELPAYSVNGGEL
ncbi:C-terminal binding protein [Haloarcula sp. JP-L23]|uniref:C-terminal binding protein n=1 Tax=Haloarcula sp. JP-L23 TaxID=2716717 RepID=UPI00140EC4C5|nr:C-terminal binding protein [Haloarcula sp. JP-L23]